jgi:hypothetical protein
LSARGANAVNGFVRGFVMTPSVALFSALPLLAALAAGPAAAEPLSDDALVKLCLDEIASRQPEGQDHGAPKIGRQDIKRSDKQDEVTLDLSYAEGRPVHGRCIIRNGKLFDYRG